MMVHRWSPGSRRTRRPKTRHLPRVPELTDADGTPLRAGTGQPLFHVEHSVGGTEQQPANRWRIVHLTDAADDRLAERFQHMAKDPWLAEHTEIYIRHNLGIELTRKSP